MIKKLINESFQIKTGNFKSNDGREMKVAYIETSDGDDTYPIKDDLKQFGVRWLSKIKKWGWFVDAKNYERVYNDNILPCAKFLQSKEKAAQGNDGACPEARTYLDVVKGLIDELSSGSTAEIGTGPNRMSADEIKNKLEQFYDELCHITSSDEFKKKLEPLLRW